MLMRAGAAYLAAPGSAAAPNRRDGLAFEAECAAALRGCGWVVRPTARTGDQGVDLIATQRGVVVAFQCKDYTAPVGNSAVQEVLAGKAYVGASHAAVVARTSYTPAAKNLARRCGVHLLREKDLPTTPRRFGVETGPDCSFAEALFPACRGCGATLRLPLGQFGYVTCPRCKRRDWYRTD